MRRLEIIAKGSGAHGSCGAIARSQKCVLPAGVEKAFMVGGIPNPADTPMLCDNGSVKNFSSNLGGINCLSEAVSSRQRASSNAALR